MAEQSGSILEAGDTEETLWVQLIGEYGRRKDQEAFLGYDYQLFGAISGYEHRLSPEWQVGANVAIGRSEVDFDRDRGSNDGMSYAGGVYLGWTPQSGVAIDLLGWGGLTNVQSRRNIVFGGIDRQADGETDVTSLGVELRGELSKDWDALHVGGFAGVRYTNNWQDDYCETGAGSVNLCVEAMRTSEVAGEVGAAVAYEVDVGSGALTLDVQGAVTATQPLDDRAIRSSFAGEPGGFVIPGDDDGELGLSPRIGLSYRRNDQLSFALNYSAHLGQDTVAHGIHAGVAFRF
jgi:outer membrane autotransporter protein